MRCSSCVGMCICIVCKNRFGMCITCRRVYNVDNVDGAVGLFDVHRGHHVHHVRHVPHYLHNRSHVTHTPNRFSLTIDIPPLALRRIYTAYALASIAMSMSMSEDRWQKIYIHFAHRDSSIIAQYTQRHHNSILNQFPMASIGMLKSNRISLLLFERFERFQFLSAFQCLISRSRPSLNVMQLH